MAVLVDELGRTPLKLLLSPGRRICDATEKTITETEKTKKALFHEDVRNGFVQLQRSNLLHLKAFVV